MLWWILFGLGGIWVADRTFSGAISGPSSSSPPTATQIVTAVTIALAKETTPTNLTEFAGVVRPVRSDLADKLVARAQVLLTPSKVSPVPVAAETYAGSSATQNQIRASLARGYSYK